MVTADAIIGNALSHHGVKGMKWGVRKDKPSGSELRTIDLTTASGKKVTLQEKPPYAIVRGLAKLSPHWKDVAARSTRLDINADGVTVGKVAVTHMSKDEIHFGWMGVSPEHRGKGYASTVFEAGVAHAKAEGYSRISLEVPSVAKDAQHIYAKNGFTPRKVKRGSDDDYDGAWIVMDYNIPGGRGDATVSHSSEDELERAFSESYGNSGLDNLMFEDESSQLIQSALSHHGVKGMRWGVRKDGSAGKVAAESKPEASDDVKRVSVARETAKKHGTDSLSNKELQDLVTRMNLEQQHVRLSGGGSNSSGKKFVKETLTQVGKQQLTKLANDQAAKAIAKALAKTAAG